MLTTYSGSNATVSSTYHLEYYLSAISSLILCIYCLYDQRNGVPIALDVVVLLSIVTNDTALPFYPTPPNTIQAYTDIIIYHMTLLPNTTKHHSSVQ